MRHAKTAGAFNTEGLNTILPMARFSQECSLVAMSLSNRDLPITTVQVKSSEKIGAMKKSKHSRTEGRGKISVMVASFRA